MSKLEFRADMEDGTYCCGAMEIGHFTKAYRSEQEWGQYLWGSEWAKEKKQPIAWHGVTKPSVQKATEKTLKKMGFKMVGRWRNDSNELLKFWLYVPKIKAKKKRRKK
jgi:hypothetical protein